MERLTPQKELLKQKLETLNGFFSAEKLAQNASKGTSKIGIATVYRFLEDQTHKHKLHRFTCNGKSVYSKDSKSHGHFTCTTCGKNAHTQHNISPKLLGMKGNICHIQIDAYGVCENCLKKKN